ncbi:MAG: hypothetical protein AB1646_19755 [Thermodesulfobacteriota bacterium]
MTRWMILRDPAGSFRDPESGFSITRDEVRAVPEPWGSLTNAWVASGGLILCDPPGEAGTDHFRDSGKMVRGAPEATDPSVDGQGKLGKGDPPASESPPHPSHRGRGNRGRDGPGGGRGNRQTGA